MSKVMEPILCQANTDVLINYTFNLLVPDKNGNYNYRTCYIQVHV